MPPRPSLASAQLQITDPSVARLHEHCARASAIKFTPGGRRWRWAFRPRARSPWPTPVRACRPSSRCPVPALHPRRQGAPSAGQRAGAQPGGGGDAAAWLRPVDREYRSPLSGCGPHLPTCALQQVSSFLRYSWQGSGDWTDRKSIRMKSSTGRWRV
jgi:hypothetical protein